VGGIHKRTAACKAGAENVLLHIAFEFLRCHTSDEGDVWPIDKVRTLVLGFDVPDLLGPQRSQAIQKLRGDLLWSQELDEFGREDSELIVLNLMPFVHEKPLALVGFFLRRTFDGRRHLL